MQFLLSSPRHRRKVLNFCQPRRLISGMSVRTPKRLRTAPVPPRGAAVAHFRGVTIPTCSRCPDSPALTVSFDRCGIGQPDGQTQRDCLPTYWWLPLQCPDPSPNFWVDPRNNVSYLGGPPVPAYIFDSAQDLQTSPVTRARYPVVGQTEGQLRMNRLRSSAAPELADGDLASIKARIRRPRPTFRASTGIRLRKIATRSSETSVLAGKPSHVS